MDASQLDDRRAELVEAPTERTTRISRETIRLRHRTAAEVDGTWLARDGPVPVELQSFSVE